MLSGELVESRGSGQRRTGTSPTDDMRFGSSNTADVARGVWQGCIYEMPFVLVKIGTLKKSDFPST